MRPSLSLPKLAPIRSSGAVILRRMSSYYDKLTNGNVLGLNLRPPYVHLRHPFSSPCLESLFFSTSSKLCLLELHLWLVIVVTVAVVAAVSMVVVVNVAVAPWQRLWLL